MSIYSPFHRPATEFIQSLGYGNEKLGFDPRQGQEYPDRLRGHPKLLFKEITHYLYRVKRAGFSTKNWPPSSAEDKCDFSYKYKPPTFLIGSHKGRFAPLPTHLATWLPPSSLATSSFIHLLVCLSICSSIHPYIHPSIKHSINSSVAVRVYAYTPHCTVWNSNASSTSSFHLHKYYKFLIAHLMTFCFRKPNQNPPVPHCHLKHKYVTPKRRNTPRKDHFYESCLTCFGMTPLKGRPALPEASTCTGLHWSR